MADPTLRLRHGDMVRALDEIDLPVLVAQELSRRAAGAAGPVRAGRLASEHAGPPAAADLTAVEDPETGRICLLPTPSLQMISLAGLAVVAAMQLLPPSVLTAAVFGSGPAARLHLRLIARYLPSVSHVSVDPAAVEAAAGCEPPAGRGVREELERAGVAVSSSTSVRRAAGANLLVVAELGWGRLDVGHLRPGVLVINSTRRDLPDGLLGEVDRVCVDDLGQLEHHQHRKFVRLHLAGAGRQRDPEHLHLEGWHRRRPRWRHQRRIDTDLGHVLAAGRRTDVDDVLLAELLGGRSLEVWLAGHIYRAASALGLGGQANDSETE